MSKTSAIWKAMAYASGASMAASLSVMFVAMFAFGRLAEWTEWQGGIAGVIGTMAGVVGAVVGLKMALRTERRAME